MSTFGFQPVFNPPVPEARFPYTGEALGLSFNALDDLAAAHDLTPLTAFADNRDIPEEFDETPEELDGLIPEWEEWFDCAEGIEVLLALSRAVRTHPTTPPLDAVAIARELDALAQALAIAQARGARFRLELR